METYPPSYKSMLEELGNSKVALNIKTPWSNDPRHAALCDLHLFLEHRINAARITAAVPYANAVDKIIFVPDERSVTSNRSVAGQNAMLLARTPAAKHVYRMIKHGQDIESFYNKRAAAALKASATV